MNREIPRLLGKNQAEEAEYMRQVVKGWMITLLLPVSC